MRGRCRNEHDPDRPEGCTGEADPRYEMRFDDIGEEPIEWCSVCGPLEHEMASALACAFETRPGFAEELERVIAELEAEERARASTERIDRPVHFFSCRFGREGS